MYKMAYVNTAYYELCFSCIICRVPSLYFDLFLYNPNNGFEK